MMPDTFEERQAYIEQCEREMHEARAKSDASRAQYEHINAMIQAYWLQYEIEMTQFIFRAMFDPNFCKPKP